MSESMGYAFESVEDKAFDLLGELWIEQETKALLAQIESDKARGNTAEMDAFFAKHDKKNLERINTYFRKEKTRTFFTKTLPKLGQIAAIFIAIIALAGGVAVATSATVRVRVMELLASIEEEYTEIKLRENPQAAFDVPADWGGENYPAFVPEGMEVSGIVSYPGLNSVEYVDQALVTTRFNFSELGEETETNVDTEGAQIRGAIIRGHVGVLAVNENKVRLFWDNGRTYFVLTSENLDESTVLRIAESVMRVR